MIILMIMAAGFLFGSQYRQMGNMNVSANEHAKDCHPQFSSSTTTASLQPPPLPDSLEWRPVKTNEMLYPWLEDNALYVFDLIQPSKSTNIHIPGHALSATYTFKNRVYRESIPGMDAYNKALSDLGWDWKETVEHIGYEISGAAADGPTSSIEGYVKRAGNAVRTVTIAQNIYHDIDPTLGFPEGVRGIVSITYTVFVSDIAYLYDIIPGYTMRPILGVHHEMIPLQSNLKLTSKLLGLPPRYGVKIRDVVKGSAADEAGLTRGDIITAINREPFQNNDRLTLSEHLKGYCPGDTVHLKTKSKFGTIKNASTVLGPR